MKYEGSGSKGTQVIERKRSVTDGQTDRRTDGQGKNNMSPPEGGDINNRALWTKKQVVFYTLQFVINKKASRYVNFSGHNAKVTCRWGLYCNKDFYCVCIEILMTIYCFYTTN